MIVPVDAHDLTVVADLDLPNDARKPKPPNSVPLRTALVLDGKGVVATTEDTAGLAAFLVGSALGASAEENPLGPVVLPSSPNLFPESPVDVVVVANQPQAAIRHSGAAIARFDKTVTEAMADALAVDLDVPG